MIEFIKHVDNSEKKGDWFFIPGGVMFVHDGDCQGKCCFKGSKAKEWKAVPSHVLGVSTVKWRSNVQT